MRVVIRYVGQGEPMTWTVICNLRLKLCSFSDIHTVQVKWFEDQR